MLVTQGAAVAYITRWSTESVKRRGSSVWDFLLEAMSSV